MKIEFEKYQAVGTALSSIRDNIRNQAITAITELLLQMPNNEVILDIEDDTQLIWTDFGERVERVYLFGNEHDKRILVDTENEQCQEWYCADAIDILEIVSYVATNELKPQE